MIEINKMNKSFNSLSVRYLKLCEFGIIVKKSTNNEDKTYFTI